MKQIRDEAYRKETSNGPHAFQPRDGLLGNQEIAARTNLPKPTVSRLTYTLTKLGYLMPVPRFDKYQLAPAAIALG